MTATDILHALALAGSAEATATLIEQTMNTRETQTTRKTHAKATTPMGSRMPRAECIKDRMERRN